MKNKNRISVLSVIFVLLSSIFTYGQFFDRVYNDFSISFTANYISSATIQLNHNHYDIVEKNLSVDTKGGYGFGISFKKMFFTNDISICLSGEYLKISDNNFYQTVINDSGFKRLTAEEELEVVPVELSILYKLPEFITSTNIYLGGGVGTYFGDRVRKFAYLETETLSRSAEFNIHVLFCVEYILTSNLALNFDLRFRDGKYSVKSRFPTDNIFIDGVSYSFQQEYDSKIFIDGLKIGLGLSYFFK